MGTSEQLFVSMFVSSIGVGYVVYGRKQQQTTALICGFALCGMPYLVTDVTVTLVIGVVLMIVPFVKRD